MTADNNPQPKSVWGGWSGYRWLAVAVVVLVLVARGNSFSFVQGLRMGGAIVDLSADYHQKLRDTEALEEHLRYLQTDAGQQMACRLELQKVLPGQQIGQVVESEPPAPAPPTMAQRVQQYIRGVEHSSAVGVQRLGEVLRCYARRRPLDAPPILDEPPTNDGNSAPVEVSKGSVAGDQPG